MGGVAARATIPDNDDPSQAEAAAGAVGGGGGGLPSGARQHGSTMLVVDEVSMMSGARRHADALEWYVDD